MARRLSSTKALYFIILLLAGIYANYLFRNGFYIIDFIICTGICIYAILKPDTFCIMPQEDEYNVIDALPNYAVALVIAPLGLLIANYINFISINFTTGLSIIVLMLVCLITIDISRYS